MNEKVIVAEEVATGEKVAVLGGVAVAGVGTVGRNSVGEWVREELMDPVNVEEGLMLSVFLLNGVVLITRAEEGGSRTLDAAGVVWGDGVARVREMLGGDCGRT